MCFVKDLLRYQNTKQKGKSTFMLSIKTATTLFVLARNYKSSGPCCSKPQLALILDLIGKQIRLHCLKAD